MVRRGTDRSEAIRPQIAESLTGPGFKKKNFQRGVRALVHIRWKREYKESAAIGRRRNPPVRRSAASLPKQAVDCHRTNKGLNHGYPDNRTSGADCAPREIVVGNLAFQRLRIVFTRCAKSSIANGFVIISMPGARKSPRDAAVGA